MRGEPAEHQVCAMAKWKPRGLGPSPLGSIPSRSQLSPVTFFWTIVPRSQPIWTHSAWVPARLSPLGLGVLADSRPLDPGPAPFGPSV